MADRHWQCAITAGRLHMCDAVGRRIVAWLALVVEGRLLVLLVLRRRRAVGMDIHLAGAGVRKHELTGV